MKWNTRTALRLTVVAAYAVFLAGMILRNIRRDDQLDEVNRRTEYLTNQVRSIRNHVQSRGGPHE